MEQLEAVKTILRSQFDGRVGKWHIAYKTNSHGGGWAKIGPTRFDTKEAAETVIDKMVIEFPEVYIKDL